MSVAQVTMKTQKTSQLAAIAQSGVLSGSTAGASAGSSA